MYFLREIKTKGYDVIGVNVFQSRTENSLFQFCLKFSPMYLEEMKNYYSLSGSRTVSRKPKVEYKLALQEKPKGAP